MLGDLSAVRDWSFAGDVMHGAWLALQHDTPNDYIFASGTRTPSTTSCTPRFAHVGLNPDDYIQIDTTLTRGPEQTASIGGPTRAHHTIGWAPTYNFEQLITRMVDADLHSLTAAGGSE